MSERHALAYCMLQYMCRKCEYIETVWNGTPGAVPTAIRCREQGCGSMMTLLYPDYTTQFVTHEPKPGDRYFRVGTPDDAWTAVVDAICSTIPGVTSMAQILSDRTLRSLAMDMLPDEKNLRPVLTEAPGE